MAACDLWHDSYVLVVLAVAALAVLGCVVAVALGHGGEMTEFPPDVPPLDLPEAGQLTAVDFMSLRIPVALVGYHTQSVDETLRRAATALSERDTRIAILEQRVAELLTDRLQARQEVYARPTRPPRTEHLPEPPQGEPTEAATAPEGGPAGFLGPTRPFAAGEPAAEPAGGAARPGDGEGPEPRGEDEIPTDESRPVAAEETATARKDRATARQDRGEPTGPAEPARNGAGRRGAPDDPARGAAKDGPTDGVKDGAANGVTDDAAKDPEKAPEKDPEKDSEKDGVADGTVRGAARPAKVTTSARGDHGDPLEGEETW